MVPRDLREEGQGGTRRATRITVAMVELCTTCFHAWTHNAVDVPGLASRTSSDSSLA